MLGLLVAVAFAQKTALVLPDWKTCASTYDATKGLVIRCDPLLMVVVADVEGKPTPAMLDLLRPEGYAHQPHAFKLAGRQVDGLRMTRTDDGVTVVQLAAVVASGTKARTLECITAQNPALEGVCVSAFEFFAGSIGLADWQAAKGTTPWGKSQPDLKNDAAVRKLVDAAAKSPASLKTSSELVVGPGLWLWLTQNDPDQQKIGTKSTAQMGQQSAPMRSYTGDAVAQFLASKGAAALFKRFQPGKVRAASGDERMVFYSEIPFEIDGVPISVVDRGQTQLLMHLAEGKVAWLELITDPEKQDFVKGP